MSRICAQRVPGLDTPMLIHRLGSFPPYWTTKSSAELDEISTYFDSFLSSWYHWCPGCQTNHSRSLLCLLGGFIPEDQFEILKGLLEGNVKFSWEIHQHFEHILDVFPVWDFFGFHADYVWDIFYPTLDRLYHYDWNRYAFHDLVYLCYNTGQLKN